MAFNTGGSFAGGFMTAFLAAQRLAMQQEFYKSRMAYYDWLQHGGNSNPGNTPAAATEAAGKNAEGRINAGDASAGGKGTAQYGGDIANKNLSSEKQAFLKVLGGPESGGKYNVRYTPKGAKEFDLSNNQHPGIAEDIPGTGKKSDAAGRYQFLGSTWKSQAGKSKLKDFSPENQDQGAWDLASDTYKTNTNGRDLSTDLKSGDPKVLAGVAPALAKVWPSLTGKTADQFPTAFAGLYNPNATAQVATNGAAPAPAVTAGSNGTSTFVPPAVVPLPPTGRPPSEVDTNPAPSTPPAYTPPPPRPAQATQPTAPNAAPPTVGAIPTQPQAAPTPSAARPSPQQNDAPPSIDVQRQNAAQMMNEDDFMDSPAFAARRGGVVTRYARGGIVKAFDLGGSTDDENEDEQFDNEMNQADYEDSRSGQPTGNPDLSMYAPQPGAIPTAPQDQAQAQSAPQVASSNPYMMGGMPRIGAGLGGSGMRMSGGGGGPRGTGGRSPADKGQIDSHYYSQPVDSSIEPDPGTPKIADDQGNLAPTAAAAITGGLKYLASLVSINGAIPGDSQSADARTQFANAKGAPPEEIEAAKYAMDPNGQLKGSMRNIAAMEGAYQWYINHGDPDQANKVAASMIIASTNAASKYGDQAARYFYNGDIDKAVTTAVKGYNEAVAYDGNTLDVKKNADGTYDAQQLNMHNRVVWQSKILPQQIFQAALGLKDGTLTYKLYAEAAQKYDPAMKAEAAEQAKQISPGDRAIFEGLNSVASGGGTTPPPTTADGTVQPSQGPQSASPAPTAAPTGPQKGPALNAQNATPQPGSQGAIPMQPQAAPPQGGAPALAPAQPVTAAVTPNSNAQPATPSNPNAPPVQGRGIPMTPQAAAPTVAADAPAPGASATSGDSPLPAGGYAPPDLPPQVTSAYQARMKQQLDASDASIMGPAQARVNQIDAYATANAAKIQNPQVRAQFLSEQNRIRSSILAEAKAQSAERAKSILAEGQSWLNTTRSSLQNDWANQRQQSRLDQSEKARADAAALLEKNKEAASAEQEQRRVDAAKELEKNKQANSEQSANQQLERDDVKANMDKPVEQTDITAAGKSLLDRAQKNAPNPAQAQTDFTSAMTDTHAPNVNHAIVDITRGNVRAGVTQDEAADAVFTILASQGKDGKAPFKAEPYMNGAGGRSLITFDDPTKMPIKIDTGRLNQLMEARKTFQANMVQQRKANAAKASQPAPAMNWLNPKGQGLPPDTTHVRPADRPTPVQPKLLPDWMTTANPNAGQFGKNPIRRGIPMPTQ